MTITDGNRIIAEFMGYKYISSKSEEHEKPNNITYGYWELRDKNALLFYKTIFRKYGAKLFYNESWHEIINVVSKLETIENIDLNISISTKIIDITVFNKVYNSNIGVSPDFSISKKVNDNKLFSLWECIIEFIVWYKKTFNIESLEILTEEQKRFCNRLSKGFKNL